MHVFSTDISLDVFLQCNKIKCLTDEVGMIADALDSKSQLLQVTCAKLL